MKEIFGGYCEAGPILVKERPDTAADLVRFACLVGLPLGRNQTTPKSQKSRLN